MSVITHRESRPSCNGGRRRRPAPRQSMSAPPPQAQPSAAHGPPPAPPAVASSASAADSASACRMLHLPRRASSLPRLCGARGRPARIVAPAASAPPATHYTSRALQTHWLPLSDVARGDCRFAIRSIAVHVVLSASCDSQRNNVRTECAPCGDCRCRRVLLSASPAPPLPEP